MKSHHKKYKIVGLGAVELNVVTDAKLNARLIRHKIKIEEIWKREQDKSGGKLFNGTLPHVVKITQKNHHIKINVCFIEYKVFLAAQKQAKLKLDIKPVAVSGLLLFKEDGKLFAIIAKRAKTVTEYPGYFELIPSGGIEKNCATKNGKVDYKKQIRKEFVEETGLPQSLIKKCQSFALVLDRQDNVYDTCVRLEIAATKQRIMHHFSSVEYEKPEILEWNDLESFVKKQRNKIAPTSQALLEAYKKRKIL